ncbi:hypothetical protein [Schaalia vaccimaxillae]|uniref:hypothetical protein n=1 Tax=Schaalia vaccimaxillae TaxID=183916 RepID=UPI0003B7A3B1|nr:hypothetical protein [Schaalia vaccimaxillae]
MNNEYDVVMPGGTHLSRPAHDAVSRLAQYDEMDVDKQIALLKDVESHLRARLTNQGSAG